MALLDSIQDLTEKMRAWEKGWDKNRMVADPPPGAVRSAPWRSLALTIESLYQNIPIERGPFTLDLICKNADDLGPITLIPLPSISDHLFFEPVTITVDTPTHLVGYALSRRGKEMERLSLDMRLQPSDQYIFKLSIDIGLLKERHG